MLGFGVGVGAGIGFSTWRTHKDMLAEARRALWYLDSILKRARGVYPSCLDARLARVVARLARVVARIIKLVRHNH